MTNYIQSFLDIFESLFSWFSSALKQNSASYCELQTADSPTVLVAHDGSLMSVLQVQGVTSLIGKEEFDQIQIGLQQSLQTVMSQAGHVIQVYFSYNKDEARGEITEILAPAEKTAERLSLRLEDLFKERINHLTDYCAHEEVYMVLWTRLKSLTSEQLKHSRKDKQKVIKKRKIPPFKSTQNLIAAIPDLRENHDSFVRSVTNDFNDWGLVTKLLEVHEAAYVMRRSADPDFTDRDWRPLLPGDKITIREPKKNAREISDILWPSLARQLLPRDAENIDLRTARVGDRIYASVFINLFPKDIQPFARLLARTLPTHIPWRISFLFESDGLAGTAIRKVMASVLSITSAQNRLIHDSLNLLNYIKYRRCRS